MANLKTVLKVGDKFNTKFNGPLTVVEYIDSNHVVCEFDETKTRTTVQAGQIRQGLVRDVMVPIKGGGFIGQGKYTPKHPAYKVWSSMIQRVVDQPSGYEGASLSDEWRDFQNFAFWYDANAKDVPGPNIDKDIIKPGNKVYSSSMCCVVPAVINKALVGSLRGGKPAKGAYRVKDRWEVLMQRDGEALYLGRFDTYQEAYDTYKNSKQSYIRGLATTYKSILREDIFMILSTYSIGEF